MNNFANPECNKAREDFSISILGYKLEQTSVTRIGRIHSIIDNTLILKLTEHKPPKSLSHPHTHSEYYIKIDTTNMKDIEIVEKK